MATPTSPGVVSTVSLTGANRIDSLISGRKWGGSTGTRVDLTYSFGGNNSYYTDISSYDSTKNYGYDNEPFIGFDSLTTTQQSAARKALDAWSEIANINFTQVFDSSTVAGDLRFARTTAHPFAVAGAYPPGATPEAGDIWFNYESDLDSDQGGTEGYWVFLHEIGHALGLKHPHDPGTYSNEIAASSIDTTKYTVMSYRSYVGQDLDISNYREQTFFPATPMLNDIAAIQHLYGANQTTRSGNDNYIWSTGEQILETIWDGGGEDTIYWSNQSTAAKINLNPGEWSELGSSYWNGQAYETETLAIAYGVTIENAIGGSNGDRLIGNGAANDLRGGLGDDTIAGGAGDDTIDGGLDNDLVGFSGSRSEYQIILTGSNTITVTDTVGNRDGVDVLRYVENLLFADGTYTSAEALNNLSYRIAKNSKTYTPSETLNLVEGWIYDAEEAGLNRIDFWVSDGRYWYDIADVTSFTPWSSDRNWFQYNYQIDLSEYAPANYTLWGQAYYDNGQTSNSYTSQFTVTANSTPQNLQFQTNKTSYSRGETVSLTNGWVYDPDSANDLAKVDLWIQRADGNWDNLDDVTQFNAWNSDNRWASFNYQFDLGGYEPGTYQVWAQANDRSGVVSNQATATFNITDSGTGGANVKLIDPLTAGGQNIYILGDENGSLFNLAGENDYGIIQGFDSTSDVIQLAGDATDYYTASISSGTAIYNSDDNLIAIVEGVDNLADSSFSFI